MKEFLRHGKYKSLLKRMNIHLVLDENVGLIGAGVVAGKWFKEIA
jgi:glucokinase